MEMKELYRAALLILIYTVLLVLVKITSGEPVSENDQALSQSPYPESPESDFYLYYPELNMYYKPTEST